MTKTIRTLPIVEKWDCHSCAHCCRGTTIPLDTNDLRQLESQRWQDHPEFRGVRTVVRANFIGTRRVLAKTADGSCVFLTDAGRCRIHELHGAEAKPAVCQIFPFQIVPTGQFAWLTLRRSCPSAAAGDGRPVQEHLRALTKSPLFGRFELSATAPPAIVRGVRRSWSEFHATADVLTRLMTDQRMPLVRRIVHSLRFCRLLDQCKLKRVEASSWRELNQMLEESAPDDAGQFFRDRQPPSHGAEVLLRQIGTHYVRSYPGFPAGNGWRKQWRLLRATARLARGKGSVPALHPAFPEQNFADLQRPLGPLRDEIMQPLVTLFETQATSRQFALFPARRPFVESYRALALSYPVAMWLLRLASGSQEPRTRTMVDVVVALQRGEGLAAATRAATLLAGTQQLERLVAWYAR